MKEGCHGGILYRVNDGKCYAASGSTGYRWLESEMVKRDGLEDCVDKTFYLSLADDAIQNLSLYGDYEWFVSDEPYKDPEFVDGFYGKYPADGEEIPFY